MPEDNFLECINVIAETMKGTSWVGEWYGECFRVQTFLPFTLSPLWKRTMEANLETRISSLTLREKMDRAAKEDSSISLMLKYYK